MLASHTRARGTRSLLVVSLKLSPETASAAIFGFGATISRDALHSGRPCWNKATRYVGIVLQPVGSRIQATQHEVGRPTERCRLANVHSDLIAHYLMRGTSRNESAILDSDVG